MGCFAVIKIYIRKNVKSRFIWQNSLKEFKGADPQGI
jgi:hypothetical protein